MVVCCRCNRAGQCRGCARVKAKIHCLNCQPSRLGICLNISPTIMHSTHSVSDSTTMTNVTADSAVTASHQHQQPDLSPLSAISSNVSVSINSPSISIQQPGVTGGTTQPQANGQQPSDLLSNLLPAYETIIQQSLSWGNRTGPELPRR